MQLTEKKYLERWANMYSLARTIPNDRRFNMDTWGSYVPESICGTAACLAGHAGLHPWFRKRGLMPQISWCKDDYDQEYIGDMDFDFDKLAAFWGHESTPGECEFPPPFIPESGCYADPNKISPKQAARAVKDWMLESWSKDEVKRAISNATVEYDKDWVHKYTPWNVT